MKGMNKAIVGVVLGISLIYAALSLVLTVQNLMETGVVSMFLFLPHGEELGIDLGEYVGFLTGAYDSFLSLIGVSITGDAGTLKIIELALVLLGFVLAVLGMVTKPSLDCTGTTNPAQYLWTHRPSSAARCLAAPWGLLAACWDKSKPLVIVPIILLPFYAFWSLMLTVFLIVPYAVVRIAIGAKIKSAAKREGREYEKSTQFAVCPKCKRNFERPKVKCKCGLDLDYPVPNEYGYKYHVCNNGHEIPCTSGKRSGLRTICPYCGSDIETREAMPVSVAMVGAVGSGKTTMMLAAVDTITKMARTRDVSVEAVTPGISKQAVLAKDVAPKTAPGELDSECMFLRSRTMQDKEILINDISGQEFEPKEGKALFEEYYTYTDGIVFAFDPIALTRQRKGATPMDVFESFHFMYSQITGTSPNKASEVPLAIVATKNDIVSPRMEDKDVRRYLMENGQDGFVRVAESLFKNIRYFAVSSYGDDCMSAARPFWWIVSETDKELADAVPIEMR